MYHETDFVVRDYASRVELRKIVVSQFLKEEPGLGGGDNASHLPAWQVMPPLDKKYGGSAKIISIELHRNCGKICRQSP